MGFALVQPPAVGSGAAALPVSKETAAKRSNGTNREPARAATASTINTNTVNVKGG